jgi:hypothetical protein
LVPGASALRSGTRAQIITNGFVVVVVAIVLARLMQGIASRRLRVTVWALALLCVAEQVNVVSNHNLSRAEEVAALRAVAAPPTACKSFYVAPHNLERGLAEQHIDAMLIAQRAGVPTLNGYSGWAPPKWAMYDAGTPSYYSNAWRWAAANGVTDGLCKYDAVQRQWLPVRDDEALNMVGEVVEPGTSIDFRSGANGSGYRTVGWSDAEISGTWTDGPRASLAARIARWPAGVDMILEVAARPFLVREQHPTLQVDVVVNGSMVDRWSYAYDRDNGLVNRSARVPAELLAREPLLKVEFRIDRPASPKLLGVYPTDDRSLGLFITRASFVAASADRASAGRSTKE